MPAELYGTAHIGFLIVLIIGIIVSSILGNKYLDEKGKLICMRVMGGLILLFAFLSRYYTAVHAGRWICIVPNSYCGFSGFCIGISLLVAKPNSNVFHCLWYTAFLGGLATMIYPDFFADNPDNFFHPNCFTCMVYHGLMLWECILMLVFKQFRFDLKKVFILPLGLLVFIAVGYFEIYVLKEGDSMCIQNPILEGTPFNCWVILLVGTALAVILNSIIYLVRLKRNYEKVS